MAREENTEFYYQPLRFSGTKTPLIWVATTPTKIYNHGSHQVTEGPLARKSLNFSTYNMINPGLVRCVVALAQMGVLTPPSLVNTLKTFRRSRESDKDLGLSDFLKKAAGVGEEQLTQRGNLEKSQLIGRSLQIALTPTTGDRNFFSMFDRLCRENPTGAGVIIDQFVQFRDLSRRLAVTLVSKYPRQMERLIGLVKIQSHQEKDQLVQEAGLSADDENSLGVGVFLRHLERFVNQYCAALGYQGPNLESMRQELKILWLGELDSGFTFLNENSGDDPAVPHSYERYLDVYEFGGLVSTRAFGTECVYGSNSYDNLVDFVGDVGLCPFFHNGYVPKKYGWFP